MILLSNNIAHCKVPSPIICHSEVWGIYTADGMFTLCSNIIQNDFAKEQHCSPQSSFTVWRQFWMTIRVGNNLITKLNSAWIYSCAIRKVHSLQQHHPKWFCYATTSRHCKVPSPILCHSEVRGIYTAGGMLTLCNNIIQNYFAMEQHHSPQSSFIVERWCTKTHPAVSLKGPWGFETGWWIDHLCKFGAPYRTFLASNQQP